MGELRKININQIANYYENPRHAIGTSEKDTLKKLFASVSNQYMLNLANDINSYGLLGNQQLVVVYKDKIKKYVVYEGNRRLAAIKMLVNPSFFDFLDESTCNKIKKLSMQLTEPLEEVLCYVTDEREAFFIMERTHSGEDKGRGMKAWNSEEKGTFKSRQNGKKSLALLIVSYVKKHCNELDITDIIPFTTIQRIFGNRKVKSSIGIDANDENTFTKARMQLVLKISKEIAESAKSENQSVTRLYNLASDIEKKVLPLIAVLNEDLLLQSQGNEGTTPIQTGDGVKHVGDTDKDIDFKDEDKSDEDTSKADSANGGPNTPPASAGNENNLPYFFLGINYSHLDPQDAATHGISQICHELKFFSQKKLVDKLPVSAALLTRSAIEQAIIYYSKTHNIQGQNKLIWERIKNLSKLSKIIDNYNKCLPDYIPDAEIRQYFTALFGNYQQTVDPLNWVVHRPAEFQLDAKTLIDLPKRGLLILINYLIS